MILNPVLDKEPNAELELDRVHRTQGPVTLGDGQPCDTLCRVQFYIIKEEILRRVWSRGPIDFDGAMVQILPDLSKHTLQLRRNLKPLLEKICEAEANYHWGFPFHPSVQKGGCSMALRIPSQLPDLFALLEIPPFLSRTGLPWTCPRCPLQGHRGPEQHHHSEIPREMPARIPGEGNSESSTYGRSCLGLLAPYSSTFYLILGLLLMTEC